MSLTKQTFLRVDDLPKELHQENAIATTNDTEQKVNIKYNGL